MKGEAWPCCGAGGVLLGKALMSHVSWEVPPHGGHESWGQEAPCWETMTGLKRKGRVGSPACAMRPCVPHLGRSPRSCLCLEKVELALWLREHKGDTSVETVCGQR